MQKEFEDDSLLDRKRHWDQYWSDKSVAQEYAASELEQNVGGLFLSYAAREGRTIEAGCGLGKWVIYLRRRGYNVLGLDSNQPTLARLREFECSVDVELGDVLHLPHKDSSLDAYISMGVVEHFEGGPQHALAEAHRVLKPDGLAFVSVPTVNVVRRVIRPGVRRVVNCGVFSLMVIVPPWSLSKVRVAARWWGIVLPAVFGIRLLGHKCSRHFTEYRYSRGEVERFLKSSGFEVIKAIPDDYHGVKDHSTGPIQRPSGL